MNKWQAFLKWVGVATVFNCHENNVRFGHHFQMTQTLHEQQTVIDMQLHVQYCIPVEELETEHKAFMADFLGLEEAERRKRK